MRQQDQIKTHATFSGLTKKCHLPLLWPVLDFAGLGQDEK